MNAPFPIQSGAPVLRSDPQPRPIIAFADVSKIYPARNGSAAGVALEAHHRQGPEGAMHGVTARSGAGKSTLIRLINGLERPSRGHVLVNGIDVTALDERGLRRARRSLCLIFQHFHLLSS